MEEEARLRMLWRLRDCAAEVRGVMGDRGDCSGAGAVVGLRRPCLTGGGREGDKGAARLVAEGDRTGNASCEASLYSSSASFGPVQELRVSARSTALALARPGGDVGDTQPSSLLD